MKKKLPACTRQSSTDEFNIKSASPARALTVEGFANKAIVDRGNDLIPPSAWELEEFKSNNILLFNHNQDLAIGTADVKVTEDGLFAKAKISKSNEAPLPYIRDMVKEGIIKSFSVGFDAKNSAVKSEDGTHTVLEKANLLELSVVTVPMNQDSVFSVSNEVDKCVSSWKKKSYHEARNDMLLFKGAFLARAIHDRIAKLLEEDPDFDSESVYGTIIEQSGTSEKILDDVLAGNSEKISDTLLDAIAENLGFDPVELRSLNSRTVKGEEVAGTEEEGEESEAKADQVADESKEVEDEEEDEEDKSEDDDEEDEEKSFTLSVEEKISELVAEGMDIDHAIAVAINQSREKYKNNQDISTKDYLNFIRIGDKSVSETKQEEVTTNLDASSETLENAQVSNPSMDQFKAQTTLLAQNNGLLQDMVNELRGLRGDLQNEKANSEPTEDSVETDDSDKSDELDERKNRVSNYEKILSELEKQLS